MFLSFLLKTEFSLLVKQPGVLSIKNTFESGQIFGWKKFVSSHNSVSQIFYLGTLNNHALAFRQNQGDHRVYTACWDSFGKKVQIGEKKRKEIQDYFNIDFSVSREYETKWKNSLNFNKLYEKFEGLRIINQDIVDCLFSFVCSTNNNIPRIQRMVNDLKQYYGEPIFLEGTKLCLKKFPTVYRMAHLDETDQVRLNLGYRFKYLKAIASFLIKNEEKLTNTKIDQNYNDFTFLNNIKELSYDKAFRELKKLHGFWQFPSQVFETTWVVSITINLELTIFVKVHIYIYCAPAHTLLNVCTRCQIMTIFRRYHCISIASLHSLDKYLIMASLMMSKAFAP
ncbi:8-oxoguanine glycosylase ogg1 [Bonamia ostreae]|uniref:8-oxoguanine glycosylase ogg1 n=1 Tax=Bonamia ostreae TaxID=126728 RepID=A0ABV2AGT6_9EUKA